MATSEPPKWTDVAIVVLTLGIVFLAFMQWLEMHGAGEQTDKLIKAAQIQADAASKNLTAAQNFATSASDAVKELRRTADDSEKSITAATRNAQQALHIGQRPYLTVENMRFDPPLQGNESVATLVFDVHNSGRSPALNQTRHAAMHVGEEVLVMQDEDFPGETVIPSDRSIRSSMHMGYGFRAVVAGTSKMSIKGTVSYTDVFKDSHTTSFCYTYDAKERVWKFCPGNSVD